MATKPPLDAHTLQSWEDAFAHPLPVVRRLEAHLRKNIDDNRSKLRVLVGASYRDLLGTAERIIEMDGQMQRVEGLLGELGAQCNGGVVERLVGNCAKMKRRGEDGGEMAVLAQTKVLRSCLLAAERIVRARGDALQAAKLFVLSRLLHKGVSENTRSPVTVVGDLRRRLHSLRNRVLAHIERAMAKISTDTDRLPHTLCAYVLVASSTPKDALRHFLQVRYDQLDRKADPPSEDEVLEALALYGRTLIDTRELFPRKVAEVLGQIAKRPLLQDAQVTSLVELNLDIYGSWIAEDIRTFTPWVRHDQLVSSEVGDALTAWSQQARKCLLERLGECLKVQTDARAILDSRQRFIARLLDLSSRVKGFTSAHGIEQVRSVFLERLSELAKQAAELRSLTLDEKHVAMLSPSSMKATSIWDLASEDFDLSNGGIKLRRSILAARHGRTDNMATEMAKLHDWAQRINEHLDIASDMASTKWDEDLDFDSEVLGADSLQQELAKDDSEELRNRLRQALQSCLKDITVQIQALGDSTTNPAFYLRLWREVDVHRRRLDNRLGLSVDPMSLTSLHRNVAAMVVKEVVPDFVHSVTTPTTAVSTTVGLWEGSPALPVQCSPQTFRFLTRLHRCMAARGGDLWTVECVGELQGAILEGLGRELMVDRFTCPVVEVEQSDVEGEKKEDEKDESEEALTNGHSEADNTDEAVAADEDEKSEEDTNETPADGEATDEKDSAAAQGDEQNPSSVREIRKEQVVQNLFDAHYLLHVLRGSKSASAALDGLVQALQSSAEVDDTSHERVKRSAGEFWKKTYLLFGLLAPALERA